MDDIGAGDIEPTDMRYRLTYIVVVDRTTGHARMALEANADDPIPVVSDVGERVSFGSLLSEWLLIEEAAAWA